ncbi:NagB transferase-like protein [Venustampulla echinocandica]|uniref:Translation initiation factor eIF2B subunit beta n=1 Tax=Venustampulla echinocandica TaxID=2656787 RepID=A0A370TQZ4_9HELO|nr:NagB transferase-like protein [Venustampulla echinocandica]RDL37942.1 NagB transferase-like protein [Venustampulla echinocandica]
MPSVQAGYAPNLGVFLKALKTQQLEASIEHLISLLKRRQIRNSRPCAIATAHLLLRVVARFKWTDIGKLLQRIQEVGQRLVEAQPKEMVVGNIVRRVLGMIRDEAKEDRSEDMSDTASITQIDSPQRETSDPAPLRTIGVSTATASPLRFGASNAPGSTDTDSDDGSARTPQGGHRPPLMTSHTSYAVLNGLPVQQSMFNLLSATPSPLSTPPQQIDSPQAGSGINAASVAQRVAASSKDLKAEVISGIEEIIDELDQVDDQMAGYAQEHIHSNEVILTHSSSTSVQKFLLKAAEKRKFTVIVAESYPNDHQATHAAVTGSVAPDLGSSEDTSLEMFLKPLTAAGITVVLTTDAAIFAIMSRVNKVILATHAVIANGGLIAAAGARIIAKAAKVHKIPVIVVSGVYKLSPEYPFEFESLIEYGDPGRIVKYHDGNLVDNLEIDNPLYDYVPPDLVDLYITNLGAHAPSYLYRIVADHYKPEDINFHKPELQF